MQFPGAVSFAAVAAAEVAVAILEAAYIVMMITFILSPV